MRRNRFAAKIPDDSTNFHLFVEGEAVVNAPNLAVVSEQEVVSFSIGAVGDQIEAGNDP